MTSAQWRTTIPSHELQGAWGHVLDDLGVLEELLAKFVKVKDLADKGIALFSCQGQAMDGYTELANYRMLVEEVKKHDKW